MTGHQEAGTLPSAAAIAAFWQEAGPAKWYGKDEAFDAEIARRFSAAHEAAAGGALDSWESESAEHALALVILLDQFPRNLFRGSARAFATDARARQVADRAIARGFDAAYDMPMKSVFYLPFMHSEDLSDQERCIALYEAAGNEDGRKWAVIHADIIRDFGRFPHRNAVLGRETSPREQAFLDGGGFAG